LNERFEQYINGKRENLHSNFTLRLKKILWEARSTSTLVHNCGECRIVTNEETLCYVLSADALVPAVWAD
jgi:hypothetical protein